MASIDDVPVLLCEVPGDHSESHEDETRLTVRKMGRAAALDLAAVLSLVQAGKVAVSAKSHRPTPPAIAAVAAALADGEYYTDEPYVLDGCEVTIGPIRAFAWPMLLQAGGLAQVNGTRLALTRAGIKALTAPAHETLAHLWKRWQRTTLLDELSTIEAIRGQSGKGARGLTALAGRREAIAAALRDCPQGRWVHVDELFRYMRASGNDFEVTRHLWNLYFGEKQYGSLGYDGFGGWNVLQARYALVVLFEFAATLGLLDVAFVPPHLTRMDLDGIWGTDELEFLSRCDGLLYVRPTALGAWCFGAVDGYEPPPMTVVRRAPKIRAVSRD
ncbi:MAG: hypothetical protein WCJ30_23890 [Deltaproteobacteria bacterium]